MYGYKYIEKIVNYLLRVDSVDLDLLKIINDNTFNLDIHIGKETEKSASPCSSIL